MRTTRWVIVAAVLGLASPAAGHPSGCAQCNRGQAAGPTASWALDAEACATPPGYTLVPGCCEYSRHCCDNAWAGYCEHRAKMDAFWARVGTQKSHSRPTACRQAPTVPCAENPAKAAEPIPADPPVTAPPLPPTAAPEKAARNAAKPALR